MFGKKDRKIANQKAMIENRDKFIERMSIDQKNLADENKDLRYENEDMKYVLRRILNLGQINTYNNEKAILNKIKELVSDYQSLY